MKESYDAERLFPSVPIRDAIQMIKRKLEADTTLQQRTQLSPADIADLLNLCLETTDFIFNERHNMTNDSGPIWLSLMVTVSQMWMTHTMETAIEIAKSENIATPEGLKVYMDNCWGYITSRQYLGPGLRSNDTLTDPAEAFNQCLNSVHPRIKFTHEEVDGKNRLSQCSNSWP